VLTGTLVAFCFGKEAKGVCSCAMAGAALSMANIAHSLYVFFMVLKIVKIDI
jgi:hypothetical protein